MQDKDTMRHGGIFIAGRERRGKGMEKNREGREERGDWPLGAEVA